MVLIPTFSTLGESKFYNFPIIKPETVHDETVHCTNVQFPSSCRTMFPLYLSTVKVFTQHSIVESPPLECVLHTENFRESCH